MTRAELVAFVRERGLAVLATRGPDGRPQAALVGVAASDDAEIIFDTSIRSRKYRNIQRCERVALVAGFDDEMTVQCEGAADIVAGEERERCLAVYLTQYLDGRERAEDSEIALIRSAWTGRATATTGRRRFRSASSVSRIEAVTCGSIGSPQR